MTPAVAAQIEAAKKSPPVARKPAAGTTTPPTGQSSNQRSQIKREEDQREPKLRPLCQVATHEGYNGKKFVATGLTPAQADALVQAAKAAGVAVQQ